MSDKTKAALQGRQCHYQKLKQKQHTRPAAGGQSPSALVSGSSKLRRGMSIFGPAPRTTQILGGFRVANMQLGRGYAPLPYTPEISRSFGRHPDIGYRCSDMSIRLNFESTDFIQLFGSMLCFCEPLRVAHCVNESCSVLGGRTYKKSVGQSLGSSLAFLRWRRLISPLAAVTRNAAVLSPSSLRRSISSITSWGILIVVICDFAFFAPVAITVIPCVRCISVYAKKMRRKDLRCISLWSSFNSDGDIHLLNAKPGSARNTNRASNQTVNRGNSNGFH